MKTVTAQEMNSPEKGRQIVLILRLAFAAPQLITSKTNRTPTASMLLLNELERTDYGKRPNVIRNVRFEIQHNTSTGRPLETVALPGTPRPDVEHTEWVSNVLAWASDVKPGMTRRDVLRVFTEEGGMSTRTRRTYVLKGCPYIKVDVEFVAGSNELDQLTEMPDDKIVRISKPYLEYGILD